MVSDTRYFYVIVLWMRHGFKYYLSMQILEASLVPRYCNEDSSFASCRASSLSCSGRKSSLAGSINVQARSW